MLHCSALNQCNSLRCSCLSSGNYQAPEPVERRQNVRDKRQIRSSKSRRQFGLEQQEAICELSKIKRIAPFTVSRNASSSSPSAHHLLLPAAASSDAAPTMRARQRDRFRFMAMSHNCQRSLSISSIEHWFELLNKFLPCRGLKAIAL